MSKSGTSHPDDELILHAELPMLKAFEAGRPTVTERMQLGHDLRKVTPRSAHAIFEPSTHGRNPADIIREQNASRIQSLVPVRMERMTASPFAFLRGSAAVMTADLATTPATGPEVMACGDMHLANFGLFGSVERNLIFAINDFDEVHGGPWEWDVKRLAASAAVASLFGGGDKVSAKAAAWAATEAYVRRMRNYAEMGYLDVWYDLIDERTILSSAPPHLRAVATQIMDKARARGHMSALEKMTEEINGRIQIAESLPLIVRETHLSDGTPVATALDAMLQSYVRSLPEDRRRLLSRYRIVDTARKVVGVGSVGLSCWVILLEGLDSGDPLFLQIKEARKSVLAHYVRTDNAIRNQGKRVVVGQRLIQGSPDIFLGWGQYETSGGYYYVRQLKDMKGGIRINESDKDFLDALPDYCRLCGWALALAHAKSGDPALIAGYCGKSDAFPDAIADFALAYAAQTEKDHDALVQAVKAGNV